MSVRACVRVRESIPFLKLIYCVLKPNFPPSPQIPDKPPDPLDFGACVSVTYWQQDPYRIVEWLELHRLWGVGEVRLGVREGSLGVIEVSLRWLVR